FDVKKRGDEGGDGGEHELMELADGLDEEEQLMVEENDIDDDDIEDSDNEEGWVDELTEMDAEERQELQKNIRPVSRVLIKLRKLAFKIVHSSTILLPAWKSHLEAANLAIKLMPRDVATRWNSTYDMLAFAVYHQKQLGDLT
ncbi:hypothetical protein M378DRAFT_51686, partial [Amanita muscaria Koide BX008]